MMDESMTPTEPQEESMASAKSQENSTISNESIISGIISVIGIGLAIFAGMRTVDYLLACGVCHPVLLAFCGIISAMAITAVTIVASALIRVGLTRGRERKEGKIDKIAD